MKKNYILLLFGLVLSQVMFAQTTLYSEDFTGQNGKGAEATFGGVSTDLSGVSWDIDISSTSFDTGFGIFGGTDYFYVTGEAFEGNDTDGNAFWLSPSINIAGYSNVTFTLDAFTSGNLENTDTFLTQYRIDGGAWTTAATNGNLIDDFNLEVSQTGLTGSTLEIRTRVNTNSQNELITFDNVLVVGTVLCPPVTGLTIDSFTSSSATISWTAGGTEGGWEIAVQAAGTGVPTGSGTPVATASYADSSINQNTAYEVYVRADCANTSNGFSPWVGPVNFTTPIQAPVGVSCAVGGTVSYVFTEEFNTQGSWTGDLTTSDQSGFWEFPGASGSGSTGPDSAFSGFNYMNYEASFSGNTGSSATASAISPAIDLTAADAAELSFYLHAYGAAMGTLNVGVSTSASGPFTTLFTQSGQLQTSGSAAWVPVGINLDAYAGQTIYIEFENTGAGGAANTFTGDMSIDLLRVETCVPPAPVTYTFNGSWSPSDPNGVANNTDTVNIMSGNATLSANTTCSSATVSAGAGLTINSGVTLTTNNLTLESTSTSYSSLILDGTVTGNVSYERHVNSQSNRNDLISAPLSGQTFGDFAAANSNIFSNPSNPSQKLFGPWSKTANQYIVYDTDVPAEANIVLGGGTGYRAASTGSGGTFTFTGSVNTGTVSENIVFTGPFEAEWNLVGNPYPSYINVQDFLNHEVDTGVKNLNLFNPPTAAIYGYDGDVANGGWIIYNLATTSASTLIAPGQGFFVSADPTQVAAYDLEFTPAMQSTGTSDDFFPGRNAELIYITLNLSNNTKAYNTDFYFNTNASLGFDVGYDAAIWGENVPDFSIYSHLVQNNANDAIALQTLNYSDISNVTIPLGVHANHGEQLRFSIADMNIPASVNVYLEDVFENTVTLLNNSDYIITPNTALSGTGRFFLRTSEDALSTIENHLDTLQIISLKASKELIVKGQLQDNHTMLNVYDVQGRLVFSTALDDSNLENRINVSNINTGVYIVTIKNHEQQKTQKVIIN